MQIVYVVGLPRSGTKLLRDMLNRHPEVSIFPVESHFIPALAKKYSESDDFRDQDLFAALYAQFEATAFARQMAERNHAIDKVGWHRQITAPGFSAAVHALFSFYAQHSGASVVGDKTPGYITQADLLHRLSPSAKFVHIVRDVRDYVLSMQNAWNQSLGRAAQTWRDSILKFESDSAQYSIPQKTIRYEDLIVSPEHTLDTVCQFLRISFDPQMMRLDRPSENLGDTKDSSVVVASNFDKWVERMPEEQVDTVEAIAGKKLADLGYACRNPGGERRLSRTEMTLSRCLDGVQRFRFLVREEGSIIAGARRMLRVSRYKVPR